MPRPSGLTYTEMAYLAAIPPEGISQAALARKLHREPPNVSRLVGILQRRGLVGITFDPDDGRKKIVVRLAR